MLTCVLMGVLLAAATLPASAAAEGDAVQVASLNEKVCETVTVTGSRLGKKRVCATRAEWQERKRLDRESVDQAQRQIVGPCQTTPGARNGGPTSC